MSIPVDHDVELTKIELIEHNHTIIPTGGITASTRNSWRQIMLLFHACLRFKYCNEAKNISITDPTCDELPPYTAFLNDGHDNHDDQLADIHLNIQHEDSNDANITTINSNEIEEVVPLPTSINKDTLIRILKEMDFDSLRDHGGVDGIAVSLGTNLENGISTDAEDLRLRQAEYGTNTYLRSVYPPKSFFHFLFRVCKDFTIILLLCCAILSLGSGLKEEGQRNGWYDGTIIFITVFVLVSVTSFRNYLSSRKSKNLQFNNKNLGKINVLRQGLQQEIFIGEVVVGDLIFLRAGDWVPSDGLFVSGDNLKVDDGVLHDDLTICHVQNPFLYYGAKVIHGSGQMLVTSVGMSTTMGDMMSKVIHDTNGRRKPLQVQIDQMNTYLQNVGLFLGVLILIVLLLRYFRGKMDDDTGYPDQISKLSATRELMKVVERFITNPRGIFASLADVFVVLLVGLNEGLPLTISLSLSYWNNKISKDYQVTICKSFGATTLGSVTTALNPMKVDIFCVGEETITGNSVSVMSPGEIRTAVDVLRNAGVSIKLVSAESLAVVKPFAVKYGIFHPDLQDSNAVVLEGAVFRNFSDLERMEIADKITILGSASPSDKLLLVQSLHQKGQVVAVMGSKTVELPALKEADIAFFMGADNSEMAKESCDIIISNGNFVSIVNLLSIGRSNYQNIRKFLQLELTKNISGILITFVATVSLGDSPITPFQLFLVNLTAGILAALALLTEPPTQDVLEMRPINQTQPIINRCMRRNIFVQVCYQGIVLLIFQFIKCQDFLGLTTLKMKKAMIFNGFVLCLVTNQLNARQPEKKNVFKGITENHWFLVSVGALVILEVLLMEFSERVTGFPRLNIMQWLSCILFAIMSWPIDYAVKCISSFFANRSTDLSSRFSSIGFPRLRKMQWFACISFGIMSPINYAAKSISSCFANRSAALPRSLNSTSSLQSPPSTPAP
ncbi:hypothetical protein MKW98_019052 [Papaver atlanticum]|uniref:Calcium-transporting ATPase n=1 Tax=Papaver atlanticum TaxID=357466 RepID=A0AAD4TJN7_9MAGN|nr:hypothetical protein MKW98_019052 [Papaver atlanticum]